MNTPLKVSISLLLFGALLFGAFHLSNEGRYGWTLFVMLPLIAGGLGSWSTRPETVVQAIKTGGIVGVAGCCLFLLAGLEGFICVLMALPVVVPLAVMGSVFTYWGRRALITKQPAALAFVLPLTLFYDSTAKPPVYSVTTTTVINAPPERVWKYVVAFPDIAARPDWVLRTGLAYPLRTRIEGSGVGVPRDCDLSTGTVKERVTVWDQPRLLRFAVTATPPAMKEMGLYGPIYPKHLDGYYISRQGQFALTALPGGKTLVAGTSWYEHGLWPAEYWRLITDQVIHHIHRRVFEHIRALSESPQK